MLDWRANSFVTF